MDDGLRITVGNDKYFEKTGFLDELQIERNKRPDDLRNQLRAKANPSLHARASENVQREEFYDQLYEDLLTGNKRSNSASSSFQHDYYDYDAHVRSEKHLSMQVSTNYDRDIELDGISLDFEDRIHALNKSITPTQSEDFEVYQQQMLLAERQSRGQSLSPTESLSRKIRSRNLDLNVDSLSTSRHYNEMYDDAVNENLRNWEKLHHRSASAHSSGSADLSYNERVDQLSQFISSSNNDVIHEKQLLKLSYPRKQRFSGVQDNSRRQLTRDEPDTSPFQAPRHSLNKLGDYEEVDAPAILDRSSEVVFDHASKKFQRSVPDRVQIHSASSPFLTKTERKSTKFGSRKSEHQQPPRSAAAKKRQGAKARISFSPTPSASVTMQRPSPSHSSKHRANQKQRNANASQSVFVKSNKPGLKALVQKYKYAAVVEKKSLNENIGEASPSKTAADKKVLKKDINKDNAKKTIINAIQKKKDITKPKTLKKQDQFSSNQDRNSPKKSTSNVDQKKKQLPPPPPNPVERYSSIALITSEIVQSETKDLSCSVELQAETEDVTKTVSDSKSTDATAVSQQLNTSIKPVEISDRPNTTASKAVTVQSSKEKLQPEKVQLSQNKQQPVGKCKENSTPGDVGITKSNDKSLPTDADDKCEAKSEDSAVVSTPPDDNLAEKPKSDANQSTSDVLAQKKQNASSLQDSDAIKEEKTEKEVAEAPCSNKKKAVDDEFTAKSSDDKDIGGAISVPPEKASEKEQVAVSSENTSQPKRGRIPTAVKLNNALMIESVFQKYAKPKPIPSNVVPPHSQEIPPPKNMVSSALPSFHSPPNFSTPANLQEISTVPTPINVMNKGSNPSNLVSIRFETDEDRRAKRLDYLEKEMEKLKQHQTEVWLKKQKQNTTNSEKASSSNEDDSSGPDKKQTATKQDVEQRDKPVVYDYIDDGNHFCAVCCNESETLLQHMTHLHTIEHAKMMDTNHKPWQNAIRPIPIVKPDLSRPLGGMEFVLPVAGYYCELCGCSSADAANAVLHCQSQEHNLKYEEFCKKNVDHKISRRTLVEKIKASVTIAKSLGLPLMPPNKPPADPNQSPGIGSSRIKITLPRFYEVPSLPVPMPVINEPIRKRRAPAENRPDFIPEKRKKSNKKDKTATTPSVTDQQQLQHKEKHPTRDSRKEPQVKNNSPSLKKPPSHNQKETSLKEKGSEILEIQTQDEPMDFAVTSSHKASASGEKIANDTAPSPSLVNNDSKNAETRSKDKMAEEKAISDSSNTIEASQNPFDTKHADSDEQGREKSASIFDFFPESAKPKTSGQRYAIPGLNCSEDEEDHDFLPTGTSDPVAAAFVPDNSKDTTSDASVVSSCLTTSKDVEMNAKANDGQRRTKEVLKVSPKKKRVDTLKLPSGTTYHDKSLSTSSEASIDDIFAPNSNQISDAEMPLVEKACDDVSQSTNNSACAKDLMQTDQLTSSRADNIFEISTLSLLAYKNEIPSQKDLIESSPSGHIKLSKESKNEIGKTKIKVSNLSVRDCLKGSAPKEQISASSPKQSAAAPAETEVPKTKRSDNIFEQFSFEECSTTATAEKTAFVNPKLLQQPTKATASKPSVVHSSVGQSHSKKDQSKSVKILRPFVQLSSLKKSSPILPESVPKPTARSSNVPINAILARCAAPSRALRSNANTYDSLPLTEETSPENTKPKARTARKSTRPRTVKPASGTGYSAAHFEPPPPGTEDD